MVYEALGAPVPTFAHIRKTFPEDSTTIWCAAIDEGLNEHQYIVPGFGDAGDLCYGEKI